MALSKEVEKALSGAVHALGDEGAREGCRRLVRALDAQVAVLSPSVIQKTFSSTDIDAFAKTEGVTTRRDSDGAGQLLRRLRDAMNLPSWSRLVALATEWNTGDSPEIDVARALQEPLFAFWNTCNDPNQLASVAALDGRMQRGAELSVRNRATVAILEVVADQADNWEWYLRFEAAGVFEAAKSLAIESDDEKREQLDEQIEQAQAQFDRLEQGYDDWFPIREFARAARLSLELARATAPDPERVVATLIALDSAESRLRASTVYGPGADKDERRRRAAQLERWSAMIRATCPCPELEQWVSSDPRLRR